MINDIRILLIFILGSIWVLIATQAQSIICVLIGLIICIVGVFVRIFQRDELIFYGKYMSNSNQKDKEHN